MLMNSGYTYDQKKSIKDGSLHLQIFNAGRKNMFFSKECKQTIGLIQ